MKKRTFLRSALSSAIALASLSTLAANSEIEQVIVYGEKQERSLQDTAASVAVMTAEDLERLPVFDLQDVFSRTANVSSRNPGDPRTDFTIRGVRSDGTTGEGNGYTASIIVDGATLGAESLNFGGLGVWDLAQVEIFRGPQGTLQGRNTLMGAIVAKTQDPTFEADGRAQVQIGNNNTRRTSIAYGNAIIDDTLAFRISADKYQTDGAIDNITRGTDDHAKRDRQEVRAKLLWKPTDDLDVKLTVSRMDNDVGASNAVRYDDPFSYEAVSNIQDDNHTTGDMAIVDIRWDLNDKLTLTSISAYTDDNYDRFDDYEGGAAEGNFIDQNYAGTGWSQEFRFNYVDENFSAVGGLFMAETKRTTDYYLESVFPTYVFRGSAVAGYLAHPAYGPVLLGLASGDANIAAFLAGNLYDDNMPATVAVDNLTENFNETKNYAIFGEATWTLDAWSFTAGLRYDRESLDNTALTRTGATPIGSIDNTVEIIPGTGVTQAILVDATLSALGNTAPENNSDTTYSAVLPKAVVTYNWTDDLALSLLAQKGYRAGGVSVNQQTGAVSEFDAEYTWNYELSLRSQWYDQRLTVNANLYHIDWEDQQISVSPTGSQYDLFTDNAGKSQLQGIELEVSAQVTDNLELYGTFGYSKTEFKEFSTLSGGSTVDYAGNEFRDAPGYTGNLGVNYQNGNLQASVDATFQDKSYTDNENTRDNDSRALLNARLGYDIDASWTVAVWATNLLDREYVTSIYSRNPSFPIAQDTVTVGSPRSFGASVNYQF